ncbi:DUF2059 domain-containing protein [Flavobacterium terrisoli]|uniref:DUF2059 domain-containing protein n=1 Tax=Flavobacterium terrisoli TaxID=3242195 RepID=UPI002542FE01|nr:DUF2059 domain-containing protein [Flavobacterium buctense]
MAILLVSQVGFSQDKPSREDVLQVIERSGASGQMSAAKKQVLTMIPQEKQAAFIIEFDAILKKANEATVDVYMQEYTKEDIKAMLAFYNSPVGKKMTAKAEVIAQKSQESMMSLQGEIQAMMMKYMQ